MSRIGNKHIVLPAGVEFSVVGSTVTVKGPKGELTKTFEDCIAINKENDTLTFVAKNDAKHTHQMHGTTRAIVANMVKGVTDGYEKVLQIIGTGYKAELKNGNVVLSLGYSHQITVTPLSGITFTVPKQDEIHVIGIDKEVVGQVAAEIRGYRRPEPYHGKGVRYQNENVRRKEIKKAGK